MLPSASHLVSYSFFSTMRDVGNKQEGEKHNIIQLYLGSLSPMQPYSSKPSLLGPDLLQHFVETICRTFDISA